MRDLKSDLEICNKATPGPWYTQNEPINSAFFDVIAAAGIGIAPTGSQKNAEFIAAARTGWPETIKMFFNLQEENTRLRRLLNEKQI